MEVVDTPRVVKREGVAVEGRILSTVKIQRHPLRIYKWNTLHQLAAAVGLRMAVTRVFESLYSFLELTLLRC